LASINIVAQELPFTHYSPENEVNPLPSADVRSVYQDRLGYMWFVVYSSGLIRYDGHHNERYTTEDGLPGLDVREVLEDHLGRLWVASEEGLVVSEKPLDQYEVNNRIRFTSKLRSTQLMQTAVIEHRLAIDTQGALWVGTRQHGIIRYHFVNADSVIADTITTDIDGNGKNKDVRSILVRKDGSVYVGIGGGDLMIFPADGSTHVLLSVKDGLPRFNADVLYESPSGDVFGGCQNGLVWEIVESDGVRRVDVRSNELGSRITCMFEISHGTLWVGSEGSGILKIIEDTSRITQHRYFYTKKNGLLSENISAIVEDREGNIWISQIGGISKLRSNFAAFGNYTSVSHGGDAPYLSNPNINVVIPPSLNRQQLWIGTSGGGVVLINQDGRVENIQTDRGLRHDWVNGLALDGSGRIWIGTVAGINCLSLNTSQLPPTSNHTKTISVAGGKAILAGYEKTTIYTCKRIQLPTGLQREKYQESMWFIGYQHIYCLIENEWFIFHTASGLPATYFDAIVIDDKGYLWVGTRDAGLYRSQFPMSVKTLRELPARNYKSNIEHDSRKLGKEIIASVFELKWSESTGAPSNQMEMMEWRDGVLWIGTPEGLVALENDPPVATTIITTADGLRGGDVTSLAFSTVTGTLWAGTNGGLAEIDPVGRKVIRTITKQNGLIDNEVWFYGSVAVDENGTVYFGTAKGLALYSPQFDKTNTTLPIVKLQRTVVTQDINGDNETNFEYAALSFANERLVRYKTRLVGYDKDWSAEKTDVTIRYTNLPAFFFAKEYTFEVLACNNYRVWTETPILYTFSIQPAWWFRWWWLSLNVVMLGVIVYAYSRYRVRRLEERSKELEKTVEERTHEISVKANQIRSQSDQLVAQNRELEEKNQEIVKTQEQLIRQEKLASLGALTAGIAHEIKNPLNFVNNFSELSIELMQELREDLIAHKERFDGKTFSRIEDTLTDMEHNSKKINEHGKRADGIVRGMLLHSRGKSGDRMPTDINQLLEEYVNLAYHGLRAQDSSFNITIKTDYDKSIGMLEVVPQDLSRVFLNIVNNACYAANEKKLKAGASFSPQLNISTKNLGNAIEIRIRDNGTGIPKEIADKIFDPFFTTKPTGKGTGLGLSLSYDIVAKEHGGELRVESDPGNYTEFIIKLPVAKK